MSVNAKAVLRKINENRAYMEDRVSHGIEYNRKGYASFLVTDSEGKPLKGVKIEAVQKNHEFKHGANIFMLDEFEMPEKNEAYRKLFKEAFNLATLPFYWGDLEPEQGKPRYDIDSPKVYRRPNPELCLKYCEENGIEPKAHCLTYPYYSPKWLDQDNVYEVKKMLEKRFKELSERFASRIPSWEVINETLCFGDPHTDSMPFFAEPDIVEWSFKLAEKYFPANELIMNEAQDFIWKTYMSTRSAYYLLNERALRNGARIDSIGCQYHMVVLDPKNYPELANYMLNPRKIFATMDDYATLGKPLQVTEITIPSCSNEPEDEELQAEIVYNLYHMWFSHKAMEAIIYWNLPDGYAARAKPGDMTAGENRFYGGLIHFDMTPKPAFEVIKNMFNKEWHTEETTTTNGDGMAEFKGFYGDYEIKVTGENGKTVEKKIKLSKKGTSNVNYNRIKIEL
ncbi:MAG: endo-1,4-beta-xylanase [Bacillota bacterium]|nr:endo-1,4-beta-xylanase [Bacillota bacterium]